MANRDNYCLNITKSGQSVVVSVTATGDRIAYIHDNADEYARKNLPKYIFDECMNILKATTAELRRGYLLDGSPCQINDRRS